MKKYKIIFLLYLLFGSQFIFSAVPDKDECYNKLKDKYWHIKTISFKFSSPDTKYLSGSLIAARGNKYFISTKSNDIYSNGKTVWNHYISNKKVLISDFVDDKMNMLSIEGFFFNFLDYYYPESLTESVSSLGNKSYVLELSAKVESNVKIKSFKIWFNPDDYVIKSIKLNTNNMVQTLNIDDLKLDKKIPDKVFEYKPTGKEEIIDYR